MIVSIRLDATAYATAAAPTGMREGDGTLFLRDADTGAEVLVYAPRAVTQALHDAARAAIANEWRGQRATAAEERA